MSTKISTKVFKEYINSLSDKEKSRIRRKIVRECGVNKSTVSSWENENRSPRRPTAIAVANCVGINHEALFPELK